MVWVPGGKSIIGSDRHYPEERPAHEIEVEGFWMDISPVTNAQFAIFAEETGHVTCAELPPDQADYPDVPVERLVTGSAVFVAPDEPVDLSHATWWQYVPGADWRHPNGPDSTIKGLDHHPVVHIAYADALAYAAWADKQLPTEAQWEHAARGGLKGATYPWGDQQTPNGHRMANYWHGTFPWQNLKPHPPAPTPAGTYPPNAYGLYDMCGSVWEWTSSAWEPSHTTTPDQNSPCCTPAASQQKSAVQVIKGGSFLCSENYCTRYRPAARFPQSSDTPTNHLGFRCMLSKTRDA